MVSWNLSTMRFGGDWTPQSSSENMTGCLGLRNNDGYPLANDHIAGGSISLFVNRKIIFNPGPIFQPMLDDPRVFQNPFHKDLPSLKLTAKTPENRVSQKERIVFQPSIFRCELLFSGMVFPGRYGIGEVPLDSHEDILIR